MNRIVNIIGLILTALVFSFCAPNKIDTAFNNPNYDLNSNTLKVDYITNPDTSLLEIIALSKIRKSGYGVLLNLDNSYSKNELDTLKREFQKLDINAIHSYNILASDSLKTKVLIAMQGAQFIWILDNRNSNWKAEFFGQKISEINNIEDNNTLIVLSEK